MNAPASSVASTENPCSCASLLIAATPGSMELWRNPAVLEKTRMRGAWLRQATDTVAVVSRNTAAEARRRNGERVVMAGEVGECRL